MDYMNMFRNGGHQASYLMPQYGGAGQTVQPQPEQRHQLHQHQYRQQQQPPPQQQQVQPSLQHRLQMPPQRQLPQGYSFPYTNEQLLVLAQMQHQRTILNQAAVNPPQPPPSTKQEQPKPRLSKDEVELLENEFQKNQKPSSGRKREIADLLKVDQPRINNWFQNRRAKEKGIKKTQEFAARQAAEQSEQSEGGSTRSPDTDAEGVPSDFFTQQHSGQPSSAPFPEPRQEPEPADADETSFTSPIDQSLRPSIEQSECDGEKAEYPSPDSLPFQGNDTVDLDCTPHATGFVTAQDVKFQREFSTYGTDAITHSAITDDLRLNDFVSPQSHDQLPFGDQQFTSAAGPDSILAPTPSFPSQLLGQLELHEIKEEEQSALGLDTRLGQVTDDLSSDHPHQHSSPSSLPMSPPTPNDLRFKSPPPPSNIASRRNKGVPAQLNATALRAYSYGPRTGLDLSKRSEAASPGMRRIASATGPTMPGRIQKSLAAGSIGGSSGGPRSPLYLERTKDALIRSLQGTVSGRSPVLGSTSNGLSPMTPSGDYFGGMPGASAQGTREATVASSASDEEQQYGMGAASVAASVAGLPGGFFGATLKTPPGTPGLNGPGAGFSENQLPPHMDAFEAAWNFNPQDEPLVTPGLGSFGSEEFAMSSAPGYVGSSQPPTPSFPHPLGPSSYGGFTWPFGPAATAPTVASFNGIGVATLSGGPGPEYTFPESFVPDASARSSPGLPAKAGKQFQFTQNVTPQDFSSEK